MKPEREGPRRSGVTGKLRIGDQWNAITIIALSQSNPLKAVAELVENSIDAGSKRIVITRGKDRGLHYLRVNDDGNGIRRDASGAPDFHYVATHVCDSVKRRLKVEGHKGIQGEFGIGLLSFWTLGEELTLTSTGDDGRAWQMQLRKGDPGYRIVQRPSLLPEPGTDVLVRGILPGIKNFSGEKIQWYLASELRDRIRQTGVDIRVIDRTSRSEFKVEPRQFEGRLLHEITGTNSPPSEIYTEIYLAAHSPQNTVALYRGGTRVLASLAELESFAGPPWSSGYLQGLVDAPFLTLTPGTRLGVIHDAALDRLARELVPLTRQLERIIEEQRRAEEERASRDVLRSVQNALKEALLGLPAEEYDWFDLHRGEGRRRPESAPAQGEGAVDAPAAEVEPDAREIGDEDEIQKQFFEFAGPLFSVRIAPIASVVAAGAQRGLRSVARDRSRRPVEERLQYRWSIIEGEGSLDNVESEIAVFHAAHEPGLVRIGIEVRQDEIVCHAEAMVTVVASLVPKSTGDGSMYQGLPGYTYQKAAGELWRSRYDAERNLVVINNGHRDFVYAARNKSLKLRYVCRLFAKELVLRNFVGAPPDQLLERLLELTLYTEENLR